jgi:hypothetical protein
MSFAHEALQSAPITFVSREIHSKRLGLHGNAVLSHDPVLAPDLSK